MVKDVKFIQTLKSRRVIMKRLFILTVMFMFLLFTMDESFARAGKGRSSGFRDYNTQQFNYKQNTDRQTSSYQYKNQPQNVASKPSFLNSSWFKWLIGGMFFGAILSLLLGHGFNFGMPGILEILLFIGIIYFLFRLFRRNQPQQEYATEGNTLGNGHLYSKVDTNLGGTIPSVNQDIIINLARNTFLDIQKAFSEQNLSKVRNLMTDRMYNYLEGQIKELKDRGLRNIIEDIKINDIQIVHVEEEKDYKVVVIEIDAWAIDYVVDRYGNIVEGDSKNPTNFKEYWAFVGKAIDWRLDDIKQISDI